MSENFFSKIPLSGMVPLSTSDWPGMLSAVIFLQGCPWRCGYCHNPHLWQTFTRQQLSKTDFVTSNQLQWKSFFNFLKKRQGILEAVVISGGEPTLHSELLELVHCIKKLGFKVGLHTAGGFPNVFKKVLNNLDWVGFDYKIDFSNYDQVTKKNNSGKLAKISFDLLVNSSIEFEVRTTVHSEYHDWTFIDRTARYLSSCGVKKYYIQTFRATGCENPELIQENRTIPGLFDTAVTNSLAKMFEKFEIRSS